MNLALNALLENAEDINYYRAVINATFDALIANDFDVQGDAEVASLLEEIENSIESSENEAESMFSDEEIADSEPLVLLSVLLEQVYSNRDRIDNAMGRIKRLRMEKDASEYEARLNEIAEMIG